jgi:hypothetical protein
MQRNSYAWFGILSEGGKVKQSRWRGAPARVIAPAMSHAVPPDNSLAARVPFGLGQMKPQHFRDMAKVVWANRDNLPTPGR